MNEDPKSLFEGAVRRLDAVAAGRLRQARRAALAGGASAGAGRGGRWLPAMAAAAALVLGLAWWLPQRGAAPAAVATTTPAAAPAGNDEAAVLADDGEDADLYAWLAEAPVAADADAPEQRL